MPNIGLHMLAAAGWCRDNDVLILHIHLSSRIDAFGQRDTLHNILTKVTLMAKVTLMTKVTLMARQPPGSICST